MNIHWKIVLICVVTIAAYNLVKTKVAAASFLP